MTSSKQGVVSQYKLWGFWVCGVDSIRIADGQVTLNRLRGNCCCSLQGMSASLSWFTGFVSIS